MKVSVYFLIPKTFDGENKPENLSEAKVCELVSLSHIDFADYHVAMHASSLRSLLSIIKFL